MKKKLLLILTAVTLLLSVPKFNFGAVAPTLGTAANFALFSSAGAVKSSSASKFLTHITGNIGSTAANITGFGNVDGVLYQGGTEFDAGTVDLQAAYDQINGLAMDFALVTPFGGGSILTQGVHTIGSASMLTGDLILDAQGIPDAVFIFKLGGAFNTSPNAKIKLINGAQACNVFWMVEGAVTLGGGNNIKGTIIAHNDAINLLLGNDTLEGRALAIAGAVSVYDALVYIPLGCARPVLSGPTTPTLGTTECYGVFSTTGQVIDDFATFVTGNVGRDDGAVVGFDPGKVTGIINSNNGSTHVVAADLAALYFSLNSPAPGFDIELMEPTLFGHNLVLTPHTYRMSGAANFTDTVFLDAQGNNDAVFIIKIFGALNAQVNSNVRLINGTQAKNVYWLVNGAVDIGVNSIFNGTVIVDGAINLQTGVLLNGRVLTINGALTTHAMTVNVPSGIASASGNITGAASICTGQSGLVYSVPVISGATSYNWTIPAAAIITAGNNTNTITIDFATALSGNISVNGIGNCSNGLVSPTFTVTVNSIPTLSVSSDITLCSGISTVLTVSGAATYAWSPAIGLNVTTGNSVTSRLATTTTYTITGITGNCNVTDSVRVTINAIPTLTSSSDMTICTSAFATLTTGGANTYTWSPASGLNSTTGNSVTSTPVSSVTYTITGVGNNTCTNTKIISITINPVPTVLVSSDVTICSGSAVVLTATGAASYAWSPGTGLSTTTGNIINATPTINMSYTVVGFNADGCSGSNNIINVKVNPVPTVLVSSDVTICSGSAAVLTATGAASYAWSPGTGLSTTTGNIINATPTINMSYTVVGFNAGGCSGSNNIINVKVNPIPTLNNIPDQSICANAATSVVIFSGGVAGTTFNWTNDFTSIGLVASGSGDISSFTAINTGTDTVTSTIVVVPSANGCIGVPSSFKIKVNNCIQTDFNIPEGFSPNGDGINDVFVIRGISNYPDNSFTVYNRWGNLVFQASPYQNNWNGKTTLGLRIGGDELPIATYFYILDLGNGTAIIKGIIYLNR